MAAHDSAVGVRVIEYAGHGRGIAAAYAAWLLARMGAHVTRWVDASATSQPASKSTALDLALQVLDEGKESATLPQSTQDIDASLSNANIFL